jgi:4-hydroxy-tetrahydrodipicolinate synthase
MLSAQQLRGQLFPAVPAPMTADGRIHVDGQRRYVAHLAAEPIGGVAVWAHTGRGLLLTEAQREQVLTAWRAGLGTGRILIASAGTGPAARDFDALCLGARRMARQAADLGADAVLVHPPSLIRGRPDQDRLVLDYHAAVAEAGLPLILFLLYEAAGGVSYRADVLETLLNRPEVLGVKVATLDSVMTFQDVAALIQSRAPSKVLVSGEDRFLGYSLMAGAEAALVGMGAACASMQVELLQAHHKGDAERFLTLNRWVDDLGRHTFRAPMEGYIRRMLWCLVHQGVLPAEAAHDPWGPDLDPAEFDQLGACLDRIAAQA